MFKVNVFLLLIMVVSALSVVNVQHEARKLNMALEHEREVARELNVEWGRLKLEQSTWVARRHIEGFAREKLNMQLPSDQRVQIISARKIEGSQWAELNDVE